MALLQPQQTLQQWFILDFEDNGGYYEVEVDMVGSHAGAGDCIQKYVI